MSDLYLFKKSGSVVEKIESRLKGGRAFAGFFSVRRIDTGKEMLVSEEALVPLKQILACPYCGKGLREDRNACCGEAGHGELVWVTDDADQTEITVPRRNPS